jgi:DNA-binding NarL/FixJ family response regulator
MAGTDATIPRRVLILSDDSLTRSGLLGVLQGEPGLQGILPEEHQTDDFAPITRPPAEAVLWDVSHGRRMADEVRALAAAGSGVVALVEADVERAVARSAGALGVLPRSVGQAMLIAAIHAVCAGLYVSDPESARPSASEDGLLAGFEPLTPRELEVLRLIAEGLPNKAVASRLGIRESTVKDHVNALLGKLGAQSRTEAVTIALRQGLISI